MFLKLRLASSKGLLQSDLDVLPSWADSGRFARAAHEGRREERSVVEVLSLSLVIFRRLLKFFRFHFPFSGHLEAIVGPSSALVPRSVPSCPLGFIWGSSWALLGPSWALLGGPGGGLGGVLGGSWGGLGGVPGGLFGDVKISSR